MSEMKGWKRIYRLPNWVWKKWKRDYGYIDNLTLGHIGGHSCEYTGKRFSYKVVIDNRRCIRYYRRAKREDKRGRDPGTVSGICAGCEKVFDILYKKGRLYYCKECLKSLQSKEGVKSNFEKDTEASFIRRSRVDKKGVKKGQPIKKIFVAGTFIVVCIFVYSVYMEFLNQEISINNVLVEPKTVFSGDRVNVCVYVSKSPSVFGRVVDLIDYLVGYSEYFEIDVNGKIMLKEAVNIGVNESKIYVYPILVREPGAYIVSINGISDGFSVLWISRFEGYNVTVTPSDPCTGEDIEARIFLRNIGGIEYTQFLMCSIDGGMFKGENVLLKPGGSEQVCFLFDGMGMGEYNFSFSWETGKESLVVKVVEPIIDDVTGKYNFWIDGTQHRYYIGLVKAPDGVVVNSYGEFIVLINNKDAKNPTYSQLLDFLKLDKTDQYPYQFSMILLNPYFGSAEDHVDLDLVKEIIDGTEQMSPPRICADFAEVLHNNAEKAGIRCAYVSIELGEDGHALNAFNTTDNGLVYIDVTGVWGMGPSNCDKVVSVKVGNSYIPRSLFPESGWSSTWDNMGEVTNIFITWNGEWDG